MIHKKVARKIPYVIDSHDHVLSKILDGLLKEYKSQFLGLTKAYFQFGVGVLTILSE